MWSKQHSPCCSRLCVLSLRCVWCDASGLARGTGLQYDVDTEKPTESESEHRADRRRESPGRRNNSCAQVTAAEDKKLGKQRGKSVKQPTVNHWRELFVWSLVTYSFLWSAHSLSRLSRRRITPFSSRSFEGVRIWTEGDSSHRQHVPCHCHLPLHAVDSAEYSGCVRRAHRLHEHWLAGGIPPHPRCRVRPPWGHGGRRGLQAHFRHLRPLYKTAPPAAWDPVWAVRGALWGDCQRVLAGYFYLPGCRDPAAVCRGVHLGLHHVLPKHHEEEHLQCVWIAARDRRWDSHTITHMLKWFRCRSREGLLGLEGLLPLKCLSY